MNRVCTLMNRTYFIQQFWRPFVLYYIDLCLQGININTKEKYARSQRAYLQHNVYSAGVRFSILVNSCPCARHEGVWINAGIAPLVFKLDTRSKWVVIVTPLPLNLQEACWAPEPVGSCSIVATFHRQTTVDPRTVDSRPSLRLLFLCGI